jgi:FkbM family methyltransferase
MSVHETALQSSVESSKDKPGGKFIGWLLSGLLASSLNYERENRDFVRYQFNFHARGRLWLEDQFNYLMSRLGFFARHYDAKNACAWLSFVLAHADDFESFYQQLDQPSRDLLVEVIKFRILGVHHVRLPANNTHYAQTNALINRSIIRPQTVRIDSFPYVLNQYRLNGKEGTLSLHGDACTLRNTFLLQQYRHSTEQVVIEARPGEVVLDGGGCWGDTALYFADRVGDTGRVYSFEFDDQNLEIFNKNLAENPRLARRVQIVPLALWETSGQSITYAPQRGAATALDPEAQSGKTARTTSIDSWVRESGLGVGFIKLDIEGAELKALQGAGWTLRTFRPRLAVCLYHGMNDFVDIPRYLSGLGVGYRFYLGHVTMYHEETVLFATASHDEI